MLDLLSEHLKARKFEIKENHNLRAETYIQIDTVASIAVYPRSVDELIDVTKILAESGAPYRVLGRMSNVLFKTQKYNGVIVKTDRINGFNFDKTIMTLECGCFFPNAVKKAARLNLGGFEGLWGIPASVGGMLRQNAGAYGYQISDRFLSCTAYDTESSSLLNLDKEDMHFSYRSSVLEANRYVVLSACFLASEQPANEIFSGANRFAEIRRSSQPVAEPSLGSVFKKHCNVGAGYFIDRLGLKGTACGGAAISDKHAGFIVNTGNATSQDVIKLIEYIKERVLLEFGVALEEEIEII